MRWYRDRGLWVKVTHDGAVTATVLLAGELDIASAGAARAAIERLPGETKRIVVDTRRVSFIDAAGAGFLVAARQQAAAAGQEFSVHRPSRAVRRLCRLGGAPAMPPGEALPPGDRLAAAAADVLAVAIRLSGADMGNVQVVEPASGALRIVAQRGFGRAFLDFFETVDSEDSACGAALLSGRPVRVPDVTTSPIFAGTPALEVMLEAGSVAVASVPVRGADGETIAMISAHWRRPMSQVGGPTSQLAGVAEAAGALLSPAG